MFLSIAQLDPNARFDGKQNDPDDYKEPPALWYFCCFIDDVFWYGFYAYVVYVLRNLRYDKGQCDIYADDLACPPFVLWW